MAFCICHPISPFADTPQGLAILRTLPTSLERSGKRALREIHGGKSNRADALVRCIATLPDAIRCRLGLENDEYARIEMEAKSKEEAIGRLRRWLATLDKPPVSNAKL